MRNKDQNVHFNQVQMKVETENLSKKYLRKMKIKKMMSNILSNNLTITIIIETYVNIHY